MNLTVTDCSPLLSTLSSPQSLPLRSISDIAAEPILVIAPHPDDETLGCGGAIALLKHQGYTVKILVMSDGTQSHPSSRKYPASALKHLRESETRCAMHILGVEPSHIMFLNLSDGAVPTPEVVNFSAVVNHFCHYLANVNPKIILAPWRSDPHPDHRATSQILQAALAQTQCCPRVIEYPIWDWDPNQRQPWTKALQQAWRLDISGVVALKQQAIAVYRSQTTDLIDDDPNGFRLTPEMLSNFAHPWEIYLEANF
jgi:LmbE family N-acetylglucosaminyl deacetylase